MQGRDAGAGRAFTLVVARAKPWGFFKLQALQAQQLISKSLQPTINFLGQQVCNSDGKKLKEQFFPFSVMTRFRLKIHQTSLQIWNNTP